MLDAPVSRFLAVADVSRAVSFYREVLGFEERPPAGDAGTPVDAELVSGEARLLLVAGDRAWDSTGTERPRGAAMIFFRTDDVAGLHHAVAGRGGSPSGIEKVSWLKYRMFQLRDPDGHTLWFGQTYQEPDVPRPAPRIRQALPHLPLSDVAAGVRHYCEVLGFSINHQQDGLGVLDRDRVTLLLLARSGGFTGIGSCSFYVEDVDALHAELTAKGARVQGAPVSRPWGLREFTVLDPEGNRLTFSQTFE